MLSLRIGVTFGRMDSCSVSATSGGHMDSSIVITCYACIPLWKAVYPIGDKCQAA